MSERPIWICAAGQTVRGRVLLASDNNRSLLVALDEPLRTGRGGIYMDCMALLRQESGEYCDLLEGAEMRVHWEQQH